MCIFLMVFLMLSCRFYEALMAIKPSIGNLVQFLANTYLRATYPTALSSNHLSTSYVIRRTVAWNLSILRNKEAKTRIMIPSMGLSFT